MTVPFLVQPHPGPTSTSYTQRTLSAYQEESETPGRSSYTYLFLVVEYIAHPLLRKGKETSSRLRSPSLMERETGNSADW